MNRLTTILAALAVTLTATAPMAQDETQDRLGELLAQLSDPEAQNVASLEDRIGRIWQQSGSPTVDLLLQRGRDAMDAGEMIVAVEHFTAAVNHDPSFAEAWNARATAYFLMDEFGLSIADIEQTLALNPVHFGALAGLGMIYDRLNQPDLAYAAFRAAQSINPHMPPVNDAVTRLRISGIGQSL